MAADELLFHDFSCAMYLVPRFSLHKCVYSRCACPKILLAENSVFESFLCGFFNGRGLRG